MGGAALDEQARLLNDCETIVILLCLCPLHSIDKLDLRYMSSRMHWFAQPSETLGSKVVVSDIVCRHARVCQAARRTQTHASWCRPGKCNAKL